MLEFSSYSSNIATVINRTLFLTTVAINRSVSDKQTTCGDFTQQKWALDAGLNHWLLVFRHPSEKYDESIRIVTWDDEIPNINGKIKCSKPPTRSHDNLHQLVMCADASCETSHDVLINWPENFRMLLRYQESLATSPRNTT